MAVAIWVVVKLPQEYWIHVARLDVTDLLGRLAPAVAVGVVLALLALGAGVAVAAWRVAPEPDHEPRLAADPLPIEMDTAQQRARFVSTRWRVLDTRLAEKVALVALVCVVFAQVLPGVDASPPQVLVAVTVVVAYNSLVRVQFARAGRSVESAVSSFLLLAGINTASVLVADAVLRRAGGDLFAGRTVFFLLLLTLLVTMYDRWHPVYEWRLAHAVPVPP